MPLSAASLGSGTTGTDKGKPGATRGRKATGLGNQSAGLPKARLAGSPAAEVRPTEADGEDPMRILSRAGTTVRHGVGAAAEAAVIVAIGVALVFGAAVITQGDPAGAADVYAAKGGNGGGNAGTAPAASISLNQTYAGLKLGDAVTFTTSAGGLNGGEYPLVYLECKSVLDGSVLYGQLDHPDASFILGGGSSQWWLVGGDANCDAVLYSYGGKARGGYDEIRLLAGPAEFYAAG